MPTLYKPDGTVETIQPGTKLSLERMQKLVGGYVQSIKLNADLRMVVDEDGRLKGLPPNEGATAALRSFLGPDTVVIVGNALVGNKKEFGLG
jgi:hypothetical protein